MDSKPEGQNELPEFAVTMSGKKWDPRKNEWPIFIYERRTPINFSTISEYLENNLLHAFKYVLMRYAMVVSASRVRNVFEDFKGMLKRIAKNGKAHIITSEDVMKFRLSFKKTDEYRFGSFRAFLRFWSELDVYGIEADAIELAVELKVKRNRSGVAVLTMDPQKGPFTHLEYHRIVVSLMDALKNEGITRAEFLVCWLFIIFGLRPIQIAALKCKDLKEIEGRGGKKRGVLTVPSAKKRFSPIRVRFERKMIFEDFFQLVKEHHLDQIRIDGSLDCVGKEFPMFHGKQRTKSFGYHMDASGITIILQSVIDGLNVISERTHQRIKPYPRRFRYTFATRLADEGKGVIAIAEGLGHEDTSSASIYVDCSVKMRKRIDKATALGMKSTLNAFQGKFQQAKGDEMDFCHSISMSSEGCVDPVGKCGIKSDCYALAPIACYTCPSFFPRLDGPHEKVLDELIKQRDALPRTGIESMKASTYELAIIACSEVIRLCALKKKKGAAA